MGSDHSIVGAIASLIGQVRSTPPLTGDPRRAIESAHEALAIASALDDLELRVGPLSNLAWAYLTAGDFRRAAEAYRESIGAVSESPASPAFGSTTLIRVSSRAFLVWALAELGEFETALAPAEEALRIAETVNRPYFQLQASFARGFLHLRRGEFARGIPVLEQALEICHVSNLRALGFHGVAAFLGANYAWSGRVADAITLLEPVVAQTAAMGAWFDHLIAIIPLGEAHLLAGNLAEARRVATSAVEVCVAHGERGHQAWALRLLGEVAAADAGPDSAAAERHYREALGLAEELGMRPLVAHCHHGLGKLYRRTGKSSESNEHLVTTRAMYREMAMTYWLERAEAELK